MKVHTFNECGPLSKNHKVVIAAHQKGLTTIKISGPVKDHHGKGWILECDQIKWIRIYGDVKTAASKVNAWKWQDGKLIF